MSDGKTHCKRVLSGRLKNADASRQWLDEIAKQSGIKIGTRT
jgi:hypothetical protein